MAETRSQRTMREIVRIIAGRFLGMVLIFAAILAAAGIATALVPRWYRSDISLMAEPAPIAEPFKGASNLRDDISLYVVTQREIILSDYVIASALLALDGRDMPAADAIDAQPQRVAAWDKAVADYIAGNVTWIGRIRERLSMVTPGGPDATFTQTFTIRVDWQEDIGTRGQLGWAGSRRRAAERSLEFARQVRSAYLLRYAQLQAERTRKAAEALESQSLAMAREQLNSATRAIQDFVDQHLKGDLLHVRHLINAGGSGTETGIAILRTTLETQLSNLEATIDERKALQEAAAKLVGPEVSGRVKALLADESNAAALHQAEAMLVVPESIAAAYPPMRDLQARGVALRMRLNELGARYTQGYEEIRGLRRELAGNLGSLADELGKQKIALDMEIEILEARRASLHRTLKKVTDNMEVLSGKAAGYEQLQRQLEAAQRLFNDEQRRWVTAATAGRMSTHPFLVTVLDEPTQPDPGKPLRPVIWLNLTLAALAGFVLAMLYAFVADHFDHTLKSVVEAERHLGVAVLAVVPKLSRPIVWREDGAPPAREQPAPEAPAEPEQPPTDRGSPPDVTGLGTSARDDQHD